MRTIVELSSAVDQARIDMLSAWRIQSQTTCDEGSTMDQAEHAINQAHQVEAEFFLLYTELETRLAATSQATSQAMDSDYYQTEDGLMSYEPQDWGEIPY